PPPPLPGAGTHVVERVFLPEDGGDDHAITLVYVRLVARRLTAQVHVLGSGGAWEAPTTAETELPAVAPSGDDDDGDEAVEAVLPPINGEVYVVTTSGYTYTLGLRKSSTSLSVLDLPNAVRSCNFRLSWSHEDDDGGGAGGSRGRLCLVHGDGTQLSVWHRKTATIAVGVGWELRHTFCVREACQRIEWLPERWWTGRASVMAVGGDAEFALLDLEQAGIVIYVHLQWRTVKKVYERKTGGGAEDGRSAVRVFPLTTVWPPTFPEFDTEAQNSGERSVDGSNDDPDGLVGAVVMSCHEGFSATSPTYVAARGREDDAGVAAGWFQRLAAVVAAIADCIA
uniref:F-box protein AT5G49610-like beta-propeller domain-containing protein n=2 Tax=Oryza brachyantha TaxID=4533 RepID=J3LWR6_ORYBR